MQSVVVSDLRIASTDCNAIDANLVRSHARMGGHSCSVTILKVNKRSCCLLQDKAPKADVDPEALGIYRHEVFRLMACLMSSLATGILASQATS